MNGFSSVFVILKLILQLLATFITIAHARPIDDVANKRTNLGTPGRTDELLHSLSDAIQSQSQNVENKKVIDEQSVMVDGGRQFWMNKPTQRRPNQISCRFSLLGYDTAFSQVWVRTNTENLNNIMVPVSSLYFVCPAIGHECCSLDCCGPFGADADKLNEVLEWDYSPDQVDNEYEQNYVGDDNESTQQPNWIDADQNTEQSIIDNSITPRDDFVYKPQRKPRPKSHFSLKWLIVCFMLLMGFIGAALLLILIPRLTGLKEGVPNQSRVLQWKLYRHRNERPPPAVTPYR